MLTTNNESHVTGEKPNTCVQPLLSKLWNQSMLKQRGGQRRGDGFDWTRTILFFSVCTEQLSQMKLGDEDTEKNSHSAELLTSSERQLVIPTMRL